MKKSVIASAVLITFFTLQNHCEAKLFNNHNGKTNDTYFCKDGQSYKYENENGKLKIMQLDSKNNPCTNHTEEKRYIQNKMLEDLNPARIVPPVGNLPR